MTRRDLEQRLANTTWSRPPSDVPLAKCWCGGAYMDTEIGHDSHEVVMGHRPAARDPTRDHRQNDTDSNDERE